MLDIYTLLMFIAVFKVDVQSPDDLTVRDVLFIIYYLFFSPYYFDVPCIRSNHNVNFLLQLFPPGFFNAGLFLEVLWGLYGEKCSIIISSSQRLDFPCTCGLTII